MKNFGSVASQQLKEVGNELKDTRSKIEETGKEANKPKILNVEINGVTYQFEEGMTWGEWVSSKYNTIGLKVDEDRSVKKTGEGWILYLPDDDCFEVFAIASDLIDDASYYEIDDLPDDWC